MGITELCSCSWVVTVSFVAVVVSVAVVWVFGNGLVVVVVVAVEVVRGVVRGELDLINPGNSPGRVGGWTTRRDHVLQDRSSVST